MKILVTGAGGLVGRHIAEHFSIADHVGAFGHSKLDITNREQVIRAVQSARPDLIINCAVLGVDEGERNPNLAFAVNVAGPENLAIAAAEINTEIVHFSTNYVFDGDRESGYYTINDEPRPINIYGQTKLDGERAVAAACDRYYIIRTSWVFGKGKQSFFGTVADRLRSGEKVSAINGMWASPTYVKDLVDRVDEIVRHKRHAIYHVVNSGICSYFEFAVEAAKILGVEGSAIKRQIDPVSIKDVDTPAPRPRYTPMRCTISDEIGFAPLRDWRSALRDFVSI